jgi:uncharacterized membrane protein
MEKVNEKRFWRVAKVLLAIAVILIGTFFILYGVLCQFVDGVHFVIYTITPAITLLCYFFAWLLLRRKKQKPEEHAADQSRL